MAYPARTHRPLALDSSSFTTILLAISWDKETLRDLSREPSIPLKVNNFLHKRQWELPASFLEKAYGLLMERDLEKGLGCSEVVWLGVLYIISYCTAFM